MKLDAKQFRYLGAEDWRVLTAFELGSKNHEVVPTPLAIQLAALKTGTNGVNKSISTLAKANLIAKVKNAKCKLTTSDRKADLTETGLDDGYRLTYGGYDYLALHALTQSDAVLRLGSTMGVGKESDILLVTSPSPTVSGPPVEAVLKIHRLGRTSFRTVVNNRSYLGKRSHTSWQYLSRLSAHREAAAMRILHDAGLRVPTPIGHSRHAVVMSLVPGMPLRAVPLNAFGRDRREQQQRVSALYAELMDIILDLAERGIIHGDMNEFNVMLEGVQTEQPNADDEANSDLEERTALADEEGGNPNTQHEAEADHVRQSQDSELNDADEALDGSFVIPHIIDFPQITSMSHPQASEYFKRDVDGIKAFFRKRYHFQSDDTGPTFSEATARMEQAPSQGIRRLDAQMEAAGCDKKAARQLIGYHSGAEVDLNDVEVDLASTDGDGLNLDDEGYQKQVREPPRSVKAMDSNRQKAAAGWSL